MGIQTKAFLFGVFEMNNDSVIIPAAAGELGICVTTYSDGAKNFKEVKVVAWEITHIPGRGTWVKPIAAGVTIDHSDKNIKRQILSVDPDGRARDERGVVMADTRVRTSS
jgi:hypothetical protein